MKTIMMCRPLHYQVEYEINPWMKRGSVDELLALSQWHMLVTTYKSLGVDVKVIDQEENVPDMVFAADQGISVDGKFILSNFRFAQRQHESVFYESWLADHGYSVVHLPPDVTFEGGGETVRSGRTLYIGTGFRTNQKAVGALQNLVDLRVIGLELVDKRFFHLDTCMFALNESVVFYYPKAFSLGSQSKIRQGFSHAIALDEEDALKFAANSVVVGKSVIMQTGNYHFATQVGEWGYKPSMVNVSEFIKAGGGVHCLTGELQ